MSMFCVLHSIKVITQIQLKRMSDLEVSTQAFSVNG